MLSCNVKSFVYYEHHSNDYVMQHVHNCYECVFYVEGKGIITADNDVYEYNGPTITIVSPSIKHDEKTLEFSRLFIILFELKNKDAFKPFTSLKLSENDVEVFTNLFFKMQNEEKEKKHLYQSMMSAYFSLLLCQFLRLLSNNKNESINKELVNRTKNYIKENYNQKIDFQQIAASFGYSYDRFRHIFKDETNTSINQYLLNCRLYAAKQMLLNSKMQIKEIALNCGFKSNVHFNNFFNEKMNISPQQFRNSRENQIDVGVFKIEGKQDGDKMKKILFIDTDIGGDCDDAGALALANIFKNKGLIDILGITFTTSSIYGPACIDAINKFYNNTFLIGMTSRKNYCVDNVNAFQEVLAKEFKNDFYDKNNDILKEAIDSIKLIRKQLAQAKDNSVTFVCIGQLNNASDLLDSVADEYSSLNGIELVKKKVKEFVIMGGLFKDNKDEVISFCNATYDSEYNIATDIPSSINFINKVPVKTTFSDFKVGYHIKTGKSLLLENNLNNPVTRAYKIFQNRPRESWDLLTMWYAIFNDDAFFKTSKEGKISIDKNGVTTFNENAKNNQFYIQLNNENSFIEERIDDILLNRGEFNEK